MRTAQEPAPAQHPQTMDAKNPVKRFKPEPVETSVKSSRKFAVEPMETTVRSTRNKAQESEEGTARPIRRFAVEPVETTTRSSNQSVGEPIEGPLRDSKDNKIEQDAPKPPRKFAVQPIETTSRHGKPESSEAETRADTSKQLPIRASRKGKKVPRRFKPQLIETAKRSRKAGDDSPAVLPSDKTEATPDLSCLRVPRIRTIPAPPHNTPADADSYMSQLSPKLRELRRIGSPLTDHPDARPSSRSHSFRIPDLDPIESSESDGSRPPSLTTSRSSSIGYGPEHSYKHATRLRESVDDRFSGYLLRLAAQGAENQLREAAIAAYPNSDYHEPVDHFVDHESDADTSDTSRHNSSFTKINWELREIQKHQERLQAEREKEQRKRDAELMSSKGPVESSSSTTNPWANPVLAFLAENDISNAPNGSVGSEWQREIGIKEMRDSARPPMLGGDIKFPRCESPEPARFDVTQGSEHLRNQMCYLTQQVQETPHEGLWDNNLGKNAGSSGAHTPWSSSSSRQPSNQSGGLWGGFCKASDQHPLNNFTGLMTPRHPKHHSGSLEPGTPGHLRQLPSTPTLSVYSDIAGLEEHLQTAQRIESEFSDEFVTQVYNYLSLGYPAIAHDFDAELSKISGLPLDELRQDDYLARGKGYIRLGGDQNRMDGVDEENCARWRALRLYVKEWARQQPGMVAGAADPEEGWGELARRGSWAW